MPKKSRTTCPFCSTPGDLPKHESIVMRPDQRRRHAPVQSENIPLWLWYTWIFVSYRSETYQQSPPSKETSSQPPVQKEKPTEKPQTDTEAIKWGESRVTSNKPQKRNSQRQQRRDKNKTQGEHHENNERYISQPRTGEKTHIIVPDKTPNVGDVGKIMNP